MGLQSYVLLCTETTLSNPPVVQSKSSCDVHLLRSPCIMSLNRTILFSKLKKSLCKIVTKSQVNKLSYQTLSLGNDGYFLNTQTVKNKNCPSERF